MKKFVSTALLAGVIFTLQVPILANEVLTLQSPAEWYSDEAEAYTLLVTEDPWVWHPISVTNEPVNGFNAIRKTYALPPDINPSVIPTEDVEMFGQLFSFAFVVQQHTADESFMEIREEVTIETRNNNLNDILPQLDQEIRFERDGFAGTLTLDIHSIRSVPAGRASSTSTQTRQRTYPHLSSPDNALIPQTITDSGRTFHLSNVNWVSNSMSAVDGLPVASTFTAHATYSTQVTTTRTTGYVTTADYVGTVFRTVQGKTLYTAVFFGEPIVEVWLESEYVPVIIEEMEEEEYAGITPVASVRQQASGMSEGIIAALAVLGSLLGPGAAGAVGFFAAKHFLGYNVTIYSVNGPHDIVKAQKIKLNLADPQPVINLSEAASKALAATEKYEIHLAKRAVPKLVDKDVRVVLGDKEAVYTIPKDAVNADPTYTFTVSFNDDDGGGI